MTSIASLGIKIEAKDIKKAVAELKRLENNGKKAEAGAKKLRKSYLGLGSAISALGIVVLTKKLINQVSTYQSLTNKLRLVTDSTTELVQVTEAVNQAVAISGVEAASASAALFQLGQGLAADALRGQELNSVMEQTPRLARAIADGLGVEIGALREMAATGALTAKVVTDALRSQSEVLRIEFANTEKTISQAYQQIENAGLKVFGSIEGGELVESMDEFRQILSDPTTVEGLQSLAAAMMTLATAAVQMAAVTGKAYKEIADESKVTGQWFYEYQKGNITFFEWMTTGNEAASKRIKEIRGQYEGVAKEIGKITGSGGGKTDAPSISPAIEAENLKNAELMQIAENFQELHKQQRIQDALDEENYQIKLTETGKSAMQLRMEDIIAFEEEKAAFIQEKTQEDLAMQADLSQAKIGLLGNVASAATGFLRATGKESTSAGKMIFGMTKALAVAQSIINTQVAITSAMAMPMGTGLPLIPWIKATGYTSTALIAGTALAGQAHDGMDFVNSTGSYQLEKGEMVVDKGTSKEVREGLTGGNKSVNITINSNDSQSVADMFTNNRDALYNTIVDAMNEEAI